jgi:SAM-dependent methyltransferase
VSLTLAMVTSHLSACPADAEYVRLLTSNAEFSPADPTYDSWLKFNLNGIERGREIIQRIEHRMGPIALHQHGCKVSAIEIDPRRVEWLRTRTKAHGADVTIYTQPIERLGLWGEYDIITCDAVLEHVADWRLLLREILRLQPKLVFLTYPNKTALLSMWSDPHYGLAGAVFLEGKLRWLQRPYIRLRGIRHDAWVTAIPLLSTVRRYVEHRGYRVERSYPSSFAKLDRPETIRFAPARRAVRAMHRLRVPIGAIRSLALSQRKTHELFFIR